MQSTIIAKGITGNSILSYLPYLLDMLRFPEKNYGNWLGEDLKLRVLELVSGCFLIGAFLFYGITWILRRWRSGSGPQPFSFVLRAATGFLILVLVGTVPAFSLFENRTLLLSIRRVLPVDTGLLESVSDPIRAATRSAPVGKEKEKKGLRIASLAPAQGSKLESDVVLRNFTSSDADLAGWRLVGANGKTFELSGRITAGQSFKIAISNERIALSWHDGYLMLIDSEGWVQDKVSYSSTYFHPGRTWNFLINRDRKSSSTNVESIANKYRSRLLKMCSEVRPIDPSAHVEGKTLPHIVILILESFRYNTLTSDYMPRLQEWSKDGLRLQRHYAGSNCTQFGLFTLLYGRNAGSYGATLDKDVPPQLLVSLRRSGYQSSYVISTDYRGFRELDRIINETNFDSVIIDQNRSYHDYRDWPVADIRTLSRVRNIVTQQNHQPQLVIAHLYATHYPYGFDAKFNIHRPSDVVPHFGRRIVTGVDRSLANRYANAAAYIEDKIMSFIESLQGNCIVIVTGDHGESLGEDGTIGHGSGGSEIQTRVPFVMVGPGVKPLAIDYPTSHADVMPTLLHTLAGHSVPIRDCDGRDLYQDITRVRHK